MAIITQHPKVFFNGYEITQYLTGYEFSQSVNEMGRHVLHLIDLRMTISEDMQTHQQTVNLTTREYALTSPQRRIVPHRERGVNLNTR